MNRFVTSNIVDISTLTWIKPSLFINHARLDGDYSHMVVTGSKDSIDLDRSNYSDDENSLVLYLLNALTIVENFLPFDLIQKDYTNYRDATCKFALRNRVQTLNYVYLNDFLLPTEDYKLVDDTVYIKEIDDYGENAGGNYIKSNHTVQSVEPTPDILQAILYVFTYLNENKGDCVGELCGCQPALNVLMKYIQPLI